jgi:hypothetical protein
VLTICTCATSQRNCNSGCLLLLCIDISLERLGTIFANCAGGPQTLGTAWNATRVELPCEVLLCSLQNESTGGLKCAAWHYN